MVWDENQDCIFRVVYILLCPSTIYLNIPLPCALCFRFSSPINQVLRYMSLFFYTLYFLLSIHLSLQIHLNPSWANLGPLNFQHKLQNHLLKFHRTVVRIVTGVYNFIEHAGLRWHLYYFESYNPWNGIYHYLYFRSLLTSIIFSFLFNFLIFCDEFLNTFFWCKILGCNMQNIINGIVSKINFHFLTLLYRNTIDSCLWVLNCKFVKLIKILKTHL